MQPIEKAVCWISAHWKSLGLAAIVPAVSGVLMWISTLRRNKAERLLATASLKKLQREEIQTQSERARLEQRQIDRHIQSLVETILMWKDAEKKRTGKDIVVVSTSKLQGILGNEADKLPDVMKYLASLKRAAKSATSDYWAIS